MNRWNDFVRCTKFESNGFSQSIFSQKHTWMLISPYEIKPRSKDSALRFFPVDNIDLGCLFLESKFLSDLLEFLISPHKIWRGWDLIYTKKAPKVVFRRQILCGENKNPRRSLRNLDPRNTQPRSILLTGKNLRTSTLKLFLLEERDFTKLSPFSTKRGEKNICPHSLMAHIVRLGRFLDKLCLSRVKHIYCLFNFQFSLENEN